MFTKNVEEVASFIAGDDTLLKEVLHPKNDPVHSSYSLALASLAPGQASTPHLLKESSELYLVLEGTGIAYVNSLEIDLFPGTMVLIEAGEKQYVRNTGASTLRFYCIVSPPWSKEDEVILNEDTSID